MFNRDFTVTPLNQYFIINFSHSLFKINLAKLPDNAQSQCGFSVNNIKPSNTNNFDSQFVFTQINNIVAVLNDMNSAVKLIWVFVPLNNSWS